MTALKSIIALAGLGLFGLIIWAFQTADFFASFGAMIADPWGLVALADLYLGFLLLSAIIFSFESSKAAAALWVVALFILGNVVGAAYLVVKGLRLASR